MTRSVAVLGVSGWMLEIARQSSVDEFWGVGSVGPLWDGPLDRVYEIHWPWLIKQEKYSPGYFTRLLTVDYPIYMHEELPELPTSRRYPIEDALALCGEVRRGDRGNRYLTSTFDFMMAHAIIEGVDRVEVYFNPQSKTEYRYQREGIAFWIGLATGRGIEVWFPERSSLLDAKVYGYEATQMVSRSTLERKLVDYRNQVETFNSQMNIWAGIHQERTKQMEKRRTPEAEAAWKESWAELENAKRYLATAIGYVNATKAFLDTCDLLEPPEGIVSNLQTVEV